VKVPTKDLEDAEREADVSVLGHAALQHAAHLAVLDKDYEGARDRLFEMLTLLERIATSDLQQEEYDIFVEKSEQLDAELKPLASHKKKEKEAKVGDGAAKCFYFYQHASKQLFLAGARKDISHRKKHVGEIKRLKI